MRLLTAAVLSAAVVVCCPDVAAAGGSRGKTVRQDSSGDATVAVSSRTVSSGSSGSSGSTVTCNVYESYGTDTDALEYVPPEQMQEGGYYWVSCFDRATGEHISSRYFVHQPSTPALSPLALARSAASSLTLGFPTPRTNPDMEHRQLPGIETWLWIEDADWQPVGATASIPGLSATVTATPSHVVWGMGDGSPPVVCDGPGTPYDPDVPPEEQSSDCTHLYQHRGDYTASATVHWKLAWSASDGDGGALADVERTTTFPMTVAERQAVGT